MGWNTWGFEIGNALDRRAYPALRTKRSGPPPTAAAAEALQADRDTPPRMRIFPFAWNETANSRRTISGAKCQGPALYKAFQLGTSTYTAPINKTVEVGIASTPVVENGVALTTPRPYSLLLELQDPFTQLSAAMGRGFPVTTVNPLYRDFVMPLDLVIYDNEFYPTISLFNNTANAQQWVGYLRILEQVPISRLGDYMGI